VHDQAEEAEMLLKLLPLPTTGAGTEELVAETLLQTKLLNDREAPEKYANRVDLSRAVAEFRGLRCCGRRRSFPEPCRQSSWI
jgi:hypothetical protein